MTNIEKIEKLGSKGKEIREFCDYMTDEDFNELSAFSLLDAYLSYNGIIGYTANILAVIKGVY